MAYKALLFHAPLFMKGLQGNYWKQLDQNTWKEKMLKGYNEISLIWCIVKQGTPIEGAY